MEADDHGDDCGPGGDIDGKRDRPGATPMRLIKGDGREAFVKTTRDGAFLIVGFVDGQDEAALQARLQSPGDVAAYLEECMTAASVNSWAPNLLE